MEISYASFSYVLMKWIYDWDSWKSGLTPLMSTIDLLPFLSFPSLELMMLFILDGWLANGTRF
jgi:hypothetical protein